jgi:nicotinamidase/pyrazinamidase
VNALILVDIQNDFVPGGALAVAEGDRVVPVANRLMRHFDLVVATKDWHPADHLSFASQHPGRSIGEVIDLEGLPQILWPDHCVEGTAGAEFVAGLDVDRVDRVFEKGTHRAVDSYSGFLDNGHRHATGLGDFLTGQGVTGVFIAGLATDYCVKFTALDAVELGFATCVVPDGCRGVDLKAGDVDRALADLRRAGVRTVESTAVETVIKRSDAGGNGKSRR